jgi:hypothetical protein
MASSLTSMTIADPLLEQKDKIIRDLEDENLELRLELESLRVGFRDGINPPPAPTPREFCAFDFWFWSSFFYHCFTLL